jgi:hypothetical protein
MSANSSFILVFIKPFTEFLATLVKDDIEGNPGSQVPAD